MCEVGGGVNHRHNRIRDWLAGLVADWTGQVVETEQYVLRWDRVVRVNGVDEIERARLDVAFIDRHARRVYIDVVVPTAASTNPELVRARAARAGAAAAKAEDTKRLRYPGPELAPFAVEALGRPGDDAIAVLRSVAPADLEERSVALGAAWQSLSVILQTENAELLMSAAGCRSP